VSCRVKGATNENATQSVIVCACVCACVMVCACVYFVETTTHHKKLNDVVLRGKSKNKKKKKN
jgi:hypothetical protein